MNVSTGKRQRIAHSQRLQSRIWQFRDLAAEASATDARNPDQQGFAEAFAVLRKKSQANEIPVDQGSNFIAKLDIFDRLLTAQSFDIFEKDRAFLHGTSLRFGRNTSG